jgi:hypothetical protein
VCHARRNIVCVSVPMTRDIHPYNRSPDERRVGRSSEDAVTRFVTTSFSCASSAASALTFTRVQPENVGPMRYKNAGFAVRAGASWQTRARKAVKNIKIHRFTARLQSPATMKFCSDGTAEKQRIKTTAEPPCSRTVTNRRHSQVRIRQPPCQSARSARVVH